MAVAAVITEHHVPRIEMFRQSNTGPLLPDAGVYSAEESPLAEKLEQSLFKQANAQGFFKQSGFR